MPQFDTDHLASFVCSHVFRNERPILRAFHEHDGDWQFLCGAEAHTESECHLVGVGHLIARDPTINEIAEMPPGYVALRERVGEPWSKRAYDDPAA